MFQRSATTVFAENRNTEYLSAPTLMILERGKRGKALPGYVVIPS